MYTIVFYREDGTVKGSSPWSGDLNAAKNHAVNYLKIHEAARVAVIDDEGTVLFMKEANATGS